MWRRTGVKRNNGGITHEVHEHEKRFWAMNLQLFAGDGDDGGDGSDGDDDDPDAESDNDDQEDDQDEKKFTQKDVDDAVKKRLAREKENGSVSSRRKHLEAGPTAGREPEMMARKRTMKS